MRLRVYSHFSVSADPFRWLTPAAGIWAHIQCPVIELVGKPGENDKATVKITFQRDESSPEAVSKHQSKDSLFYYRKGDPSNPKLATKIINGWTISWQTAIRQVDIMDSMTSKQNLVLGAHGVPYGKSITYRTA